ncbi:MAG TPA: amidohydrolase family protein, partial [Elusimicrobiota bacterium]|nr:amidohydrolase family protein [Elusimicrobiota bacterium]
EKVRVPPGTPALDLSGYTVLPGLIDLHVHLMDSPADFGDPKVYLKRTEEESLREGRAHAAATLRAGFTTVRNLGTYLPWADRALRDDIASGRTPGPRMQIAGYYLTIPGGGGDVRPPGVPEGDIPAILRRGVARGPEAFRRKAEEALAQGADLLKVIASGAVLAFGSEPGAPEMTKDEIAAVVAAAHAAGKKVAAHAHGARSVRDALEAGADTIEHASLIDAAGLALAKARGVPLSMDVYNGDYIDEDGRKAGWPAEYLEKNRATTQTQRDAFREALRLGVPIVFGTDAGVYPHGLNARQFKIMTALGMSPMEAIRSATALAARCMGWEDRVGAVAPGRYGDLVAVRGDPLADIALLEDVRVVVQGGRVARAD